MINPFSEKYTTDKTDENLIQEAVLGDRDSLESLVRRHQDWIYNIALRMVFNPDEAADITQEVLIKIITKLSSFQGRSSFRTWAYRIVVNHVLNMKKSRGEQMHRSNFADYGRAIDNTPDFDLPDPNSYSVDMKILVDEVKVSCMFGMLLCMDREQRIIYILGGIMGVTDKIGSELMQISKDNFRKKLSRARRDLYNFMNNKCGLIDERNPCRCTKKTKVLIDSGYVNPGNLKFNRNYYYNVENAAGEKLKVLNNYLDTMCQAKFSEHPFQKSPDFVLELKKMINSSDFKDIFNLH
ncbi:MAG: RNA polymerase sigma factor [Ignavibacteriae bacterium]|nr:MAG: RNA polymerase sigma factor [Ignavibacteriota bacterium]